MSSKGKQVAGKGSFDGKRKRAGGGDDDKTGGRKKCNPNVLRFFEDTADEADDVSDWSDFSDIDNYFMEEDFVPEEKTADGKGSSSSQIPFIPPKEEEMNEEEFDKMMEERYKNGSGFVNFAEDYESKRFIDGDMLDIHAKSSLIWKVKCMVGRERQSAFCLMQKYVDLQPLGTKLQIISVFSVDRVKGFIFIEAEKQQHIYEACNGLCTIYSSRVMPVPHKEVPSLLSTQSKGNAITEGMWVRVKTGKYKGDLAQVVEVNALRKRATVKLIPRIDIQVLAEKYGGGSAKKNAKYAPRLISSKELDEFRPLIQIKRDRDTNTVYEVIDGHMLKDGYLYKKVSIDSLSCWSVMPSEEELLKFTPAERKESDNFEWLSQIYGEEKKRPVIKPDTSGGKGEGSSMSVTGNTLETYSLVCFGRKDFGIIIGMEKDDSYKILKEGFQGPVVAAVQQSEIKSGALDMKFTALDHCAKTLRVNDTVKVTEGPSQGRQGTVKHIYRGVVFLYDENETENGGYFCCKSKICEKVKFSPDTCTEKGGESSFLATEDFPTSPKSPLSPKKPWQARDGNRDFNRGEKDGAFSVGQTLRIRVGPLKGYLCRVLAVRRSDITVKLDSKQKVLTVKSEHLSEVRGRSSATLMSEDPGSSSLKPFDLLGSEGSTRDWINGAGASGASDRWNTGGSSGESSWPSFPSSSFSAQPGHGSTDPISSEGIDAKREGEDAIWENKVSSNKSSSWGAGTSNSDLVSGWEKNGDRSDNLDGRKTSEESWGKKPSSDGNNNSGWGNTSSNKSLPDNWGSGKAEVEGKSWDKSNASGAGEDGFNNNSSGWNQQSSWDKGKSKVSGNSSAWGNDLQSQDKGLCVGDDDPWGKVMGKQKSKDASSGGELGWKNTSSAVESRTMGLVGSLAENNADVNQDAGWGKKSNAGSGSLGKISLSSCVGDVENQDTSWAKKDDAGSGVWGQKSSRSSFVGDAWIKDTSWAKKDDAGSGGWGKKLNNSSCVGDAGNRDASWVKKDDAGNQDTSWAKKDDAGSGGWEKKTSSSSCVGDTGNQDTSWAKKNDAAFGVQGGNQDSWGTKSGGTDGNQDSSWEKKTDAGFGVSGRNPDSWGKKSNQNSGSSNTDDDKNQGWGKKNVTGLGGSAEIPVAFDKKDKWSSGSGEDGGNQDTSWGKKTDAGQDSWAKSSNWNSGSGNTSGGQVSSWGSKNAAGSGGSTGNHDAWGNNSSWKSGSSDTGNEDSDPRNKSEWSGGYGGRGRSGDRGGYGGRGRDRGGFGGRGGDRGGYGGRGGDRGGFGGRGRGRNESGGSWNSRQNESGGSWSSRQNESGGSWSSRQNESGGSWSSRQNDSGGSWSSQQDDSGGERGGFGGRGGRGCGRRDQSGSWNNGNDSGGSWSSQHDDSGGDRGGFGGRGRGRRDQSGSWNNGNDFGGSWSSRRNDSGGSWSSKQDDTGGDRGGFRGRGRGRRDSGGSWNNGNDSGGSWSSQQNDSGGDRGGFGGRGGFRGRGRRDQSSSWSNRNDPGGWSSQQSSSGGWSQGDGDDKQGRGWKSASAETSKKPGGWSSQQASVSWKGGSDDDNQRQGWKSASVETSDTSGGWNQADGKSTGGWGKSSGSTNEGGENLGKNWKAPDVSAGTEWPSFSNAGKEKSSANETSVWKQASSSGETADKAHSSGWNQSSGANNTTDGDGEPTNSWSKPEASSWEKAGDSGKKGGW